MFHVNQSGRPASFHVNQWAAGLFADAELGEDRAQHLLDADMARQAAQMMGGKAEAVF